MPSEYEKAFLFCFWLAVFIALCFIFPPFGIFMLLWYFGVFDIAAWIIARTWKVCTSSAKPTASPSSPPPSASGSHAVQQFLALSKKKQAPRAAPPEAP